MWQPEKIHSANSVNGYGSSWRVKVIGGWIVTQEAITNKGGISVSNIFIADKRHEWTFELPEQEPIKAPDFEPPAE